MLRYLDKHSPALTSTCAPCGRKYRLYQNVARTRDLEYKFVPRSGGTIITLYAEALWTPVRPAWSYLPKSITSVDVTLERTSSGRPVPGVPTVHRTVTGQAAQRLATAVNALRPSEQLGQMCTGPTDNNDTLKFHVDNQLVTVTATYLCFDNAELTAGGHRTSVSLDPGSLDSVVVSALGLSGKYSA